MKLEEFQKILKSEPNQRCKDLEKEMKQKDLEIIRQREILKTLFNRCSALTAPELCWFCDLKDTCKQVRNTENRRNNIPVKERMINAI